MRRRNVHNAHERLLNHVGLLVINPNDYKGQWHTLFNNNNPIHLEIGMGKGKFIIELALKNPDINYLGIEKYESVILQPCDRLGDNYPANLHFICADANNLSDYFSHDEIDKIYLNFSDPWPKSRHDKRRLTHANFLKVYQDINKGDIEFKTDNVGLAEFSIVSFNNFGAKFLDLSLDLHSRDEEIITTEYEDKFSQKGPIYFMKVNLR